MGSRLASRASALVLAAALAACSSDYGATGEAGSAAPAPPSASSEQANTDRSPPALAPQPAEATDNEVSVQPVFFLPSGAELTADERRLYEYRVLRHLRIAQAFYLSQLRTETFRIEDRVLVHQSNRAAAHFGDPMTDVEHSDSLMNLKVKEVLDELHEDRFTSKHVFLILFVRPNGAPCGVDTGPACLGFGRPFSGGPPVLGGGVVEIDIEALVDHDHSPFQSTLAHELGHAFGLSHVDCRGYDMETNDSIMSYRLAHHSRGFAESATPGILVPEDLFVLAQNKGVFPSLEYVPSGAPLREIEDCYMTPMNAALGDAPPTSAQGYRLFFDGALASGPETAYWVFADAKRHCKAMVDASPGTRVSCTFNGSPFDPSAPPPR